MNLKPEYNYHVFLAKARQAALAVEPCTRQEKRYLEAFNELSPESQSVVTAMANLARAWPQISPRARRVVAEFIQHLARKHDGM